MVGINIRVKRQFDNYLYKIFRGINLASFEFHIISDEIMHEENDMQKSKLFEVDVIDGKDFLKCISKDKYFMIFVDIKTYPKGEMGPEISSFDDFWKSNCEWVFLCTDSTYFEFYCKDKDVLETVYNNCIGDEYVKVQYQSMSDVEGRTLIAF